MQLTKNFLLSEFACNDGTPVPEQFIPNARLLAENLQVLRDDINIHNRPKNAPKNVPLPLTVLSAYRHPAYNKKVGGKSKSEHLKAKAGDIVNKWITPAQMYARIERLIKAGKMKQGGLGLYRGFVHYDVRGKKARW
jgi:hypothetical protein